MGFSLYSSIIFRQDYLFYSATHAFMGDNGVVEFRLTHQPRSDWSTMNKTSLKYERYFERIFKAYELEVIRFARMTQGSVKSRERVYRSPQNEADGLIKIEAKIDYSEYGLDINFIPQLEKSDSPACIIKMDFTLKVDGQTWVFPFDAMMDSDDFTPFLYMDCLSDNLVIEAIESLLSLFRHYQSRLKEIASNPNRTKQFLSKLTEDHKSLVGSIDQITPSVNKAVLDYKMTLMMLPAYKQFLLRQNQESLDAYQQTKLPLSDYEQNIINELKSRLSLGSHGQFDVLPRLINQNYHYKDSTKKDKYHQQMKASYGLSYLFMVVMMAIAVYFAMGFSHWIITLESQYKTGVNLWIGVIPVLIATLFGAIWGLPLSHQMIYPDDHELYKGYDYRYKHSSNTKRLKLVSFIAILLMLLVGSWNGTNILVFYHGHFTLQPSFLWLPPTQDQFYNQLAQVSYRETLTDSQGEAIDYDHFILVYKDGRNVQLKPYLSATECESILVPYLDRKNIRLKP
ncbi:MAG: hypothetical protein FD133_85 [Erysipelotrichaceae bacterium]|nr:MAG: hypothetical protein FD179_223 [Erysipelotrichaceae bacterium]TXT19966.1 MAG: hypothetical protein FD133_85 [Erysipelotrichaceae bacterium]